MSRNFKRIASLVLAAAMLISCFAISGSAEAAGGEAMSVGLALSAESAKPGDVITVTVSISNNYNAATMRWPVLYSKDVFELVGEDGGLTASINSATAVAGSTSSTTNADFIPASYSSDTYSAFTIQWIAQASAEVGVGVFNSGVATECFSFQLKVLDGASGTGSVLIPSDSTHFYTTAISDPADATTVYTASPVLTFSNPATVSIEAAGPELVAAEGYGVRTIQFDGDDTTYLCGFDADAIVNGGVAFTDQFKVNNGTYTVSSDSFATGTVVTVYDASGEVYAEYPVIFFGDINGDGMVENTDVSMAIQIACSELEAEPIELYACDVVVDNEASAVIDSFDVTNIIKLANFELELADLSQSHAA